MNRRLLNQRETADKLNQTYDWFLENRDDLYKRGFPRPIFGDKAHGRAKFDPGAIDAWLDLQMPAALRQDAAAIATATQQAATQYDVLLEARLKRAA